VVRYFDGVEGVKHVMYDALATKGGNFAYLCLDKWFKSGMRDFLVEYKETRIAGKKVPLKAIVPDTPEVREFFKTYYQNDQMTEVLYVDPARAGDLFQNEITIYDDKVTILHLTAGEEFGVIIESAEVASMQKSIFYMAWKGLQL